MATLTATGLARIADQPTRESLRLAFDRLAQLETQAEAIEVSIRAAEALTADVVARLARVEAQGRTL